jgi:acyl carrier protein
MMEEAKIYEALREIFADVFLRDDIPLSASLTAEDVSGWNSFKQVEILMAAEERFGMRFTSTEIDNFRSLGDLVEAVARHIGPAARAIRPPQSGRPSD